MNGPRRNISSSIRVLIFLLFNIFSFNPPILADDLDTATLRGVVYDETGGALVGATVTVQEISTHLTLTLSTDRAGQFAATQIPPGEYRMEAAAPSFRRYASEPIRLLSGQTMDLKITLHVGSVEQTVVVTAEALALDLSKTVVGGSLTPQEIDLLPLNGREPLDLVFLFPGVTEEPFDTRDAARLANGRSLSDTPIEAGVFSLSGGRAFSNNLTVDGFDNNDDREARERISYSREAIDEVQVITNQFSAEYGRASGGRVNLRTRSGANQFHGRGFFYFQDESLNANSFFRNAVGEPRVPYQSREAGFSLGGPVKRDRLFFFASFERDDRPDSTEINLPLPFQTNSRYPLPQPNAQLGTTIYRPSGGAPPIVGGRFIDEVNTPAHRNFLMGRMDVIAGERHNFSIKYDFSNGASLTSFGGGTRFPTTAVARGRDSQSWAVSENFVARSNLINQARFQYSRLLPSSLEQSLQQPVAIVVNGTSGFGAGGSSSTSVSNRRGQRVETRHQVADNLSWVKGRSSVKSGFDLQRIQSRDFDLFEMNGIYTFSNVADFLDNQPSRFQQAVGNPQGEISNTVVGVYYQQDLRLRPNFSLNVGLRYDVETVLPHERNNWGPRFSFAWDPFKSGKTVVRGGFGLFYNRVLLRTFGDFAGQSGLRFVDLRTAADVQRLFPSLSSADAAAFLSNLFPNILPNTQAIIDAASPATDTRRVSPNLRIPYSEQASFAVERELQGGWTVEASYQFNRGVKLWRDHNINAPIPPPEGWINYLTSRTFSLKLDTTTYANVRFDLGTNSSVPTPNGRVITTPVVLGLNAPTILSGSSTARLSRLIFEAVRPFRRFPDLLGIDQLESSGSSTYNGFTLAVSKRASRSASFHASYTLSKLFEDTFINTATPQDEFNLAAERSLGNTDQRHRFVFRGIFEVPKLRITLAPILMISSGRPFTIGNGGSDRNLSDRATDRPNLIQALLDRPELTSGPGVPSSFDPYQYFALATIGSSGNLGRNIGIGPAQHRIDLGISRRIKLSERVSLRPQVEIYNVFNNVVFFVNGFVDINDSDFLQPRAARRARSMQLSLRVDF